MSQTFDIYSYISSLQGSLDLVNQQIAKNQASISTASSQAPTTYQQLQQATQVGNQMPNGPSSDQSNLISSLGNAYNSLQSQISSLTSQNQSLSDQQNQLNAQIAAAQKTATTIPRSIGITDTISSTPSTSLILPNLSNISPVFLVAGAALLFLILK